MTFDTVHDKKRLRNAIGHVNVFRLEPVLGNKTKPVLCKRRDYYKITLVVSNSQVYYDNNLVELKKQALSFSNPHIP